MARKVEFSNLLKLANEHLKLAKTGVAIEQQGDRLCLRAVFPPRPNSAKDAPYQQRLALGLHANPAGLKKAELEARKVGALLDCREFDWANYLKTPGRSLPTVAETIVKFEQDYFARRRRTPQSETTWTQDYAKVFGTLPKTAILTPDLLIDAVTKTEPDTRTRKRFVDVLGRLAAFAGLECDLKRYKGNYSPAKVTPRNLPTDEIISRWRNEIPSPLWQRVYGLLATYGLRPHEVFGLEMSRFPIVAVGEKTKTGSRIVYPLYPEWAESWSLVGELPLVSGKNNSDIGNRVTHAFRRYKIPFKPYDLRHCWAVRSIGFGLDISLAAAQMGHSVQVHSSIYHAWINDSIHDRAYQVLMANPGRPKPPKI